jgi:hypothetical protein
LKRKVFSKRAVFAKIALANGAYLQDGVKFVCEKGQPDAGEAPDPGTPTPTNMRDAAGIDYAKGLDDLEARYFATPGKIDQIAQAVRDFGGCILGLFGTNVGWTDLTNPKPPAPGQAEWGHALYAFGYHLHSGQKCIIAKSSWCGSQPGHHEHHIKQNYFNSGAVFTNAWVLVPKENIPMVRRYRFEDHGTLGIALKADAAFNFDVYLAKNQEHYEYLLRFYGVPADAPVIKAPRSRRPPELLTHGILVIWVISVLTALKTAN